VFKKILLLKKLTKNNNGQGFFNIEIQKNQKKFPKKKKKKKKQEKNKGIVKF